MKTSLKQITRLVMGMALLLCIQALQAQVTCSSGISCQDIRLRFTSITTSACNAPSGQPDPQLHITNNTNGGANYFGWGDLPNNATTNISGITPSCTATYPENVGVTCGQGTVSLTIISSEVDGPFCLNPNGTSNTSAPLTVTVDLSNITATGSVSGTWNFFPLGGCFSINYQFVCMTCAPEINVRGNSVDIVDGDATPSLSDHTLFPLTNVNTNSNRVYTIQNTGGSSLPISSITSSNPLFAVSGAPASVPSGGSANFTVTFSPTASGTYNSTININNGDCNEASYDFAISGQGLAPFTCTPAFYQIRNGNQLAVYDPLTGNLNNIGPPNIGCNGAGYNLQDNFAYAIHDLGNQPFHSLLRIEANGNATTVANLQFPVGVNPNSGDCDAAGNWYLTHLYDMYRVNIAAAMAVYPANYSPQVISLSFPDGPVNGNNDAAFNAINGKFYTIDGYTGFMNVLTFTGPTTATVNRVPMSGPITLLTSGTGFGSMWCDANGDLFAFHNTTGQYFKINIATGVSLLVTTGQTQAFNDGFSCATAANPLPCAISATPTTTACTGATYNLNVLVQYNNPPTGSTGFSLTVNGVNQGTFLFANYPSGSTITIPNLPGNGTQNIPVVAQMNGGGCSGSATYNAPNCCAGFTLPANGSATVACPAQAIQPTPPVVLDGSGAPVSSTGPTLTNTPNPLSCEGTRTYAWVYTNCSGSQTWTFTYTVERNDFTMPANGSATVACPSNAIQPFPPLVVDNCGGLLNPTGPAISQTPACEGTKTYTWTYTDCEGNSHPWVFTYTIERNDFAMPANGGALVNCPNNTDIQPTPPVVFSNCGEQLAAVLTNVSPKNDCEGHRVYTFTYTDCEGNAHNWQFIYQVEILDFAMPANEAHALECPSYAWQATPPTVFDNCGKLLNPTGPAINSTYNAQGCEANRSYNWTYKDCEGNTHVWSSSFSFGYTHDFFAPADEVMEVSCLLYAVPPMPQTIYDCCGNAIQVSQPVITESIALGGCTGWRKFSYVYTDCGGHSHPWNFTYLINDNAAPLGICPSGGGALGGISVDVTDLTCINEVPCPDDYDFTKKIKELLEAGNFFDLCSGSELVVDLEGWTEPWPCSDPDNDGVNTFGRTFYFRISDPCGNEYPDICSVTYSGICLPIAAFPQQEWGMSNEGGGVNLDLIQQLLGQGPLVVGGGERSLTITQAQCVVDLLPGIGGATMLANCHQINCLGCNPAGPGGMKNALAANAIALTLNIRFNGDEMANQNLGCMYVHPCILNCGENGSCVLRVFDASGAEFIYPYTIGGLLDLANAFLGGSISMNDGQASIYGTAINEALNSVNAYWSQNQAPSGCDPHKPGITSGGLEKMILENNANADLELGFGLAPNPASHEVTFTLSEMPENQAVVLDIYNAQGQKVLHKQFGIVRQVNEQLDLLGMKNGVYFVSINVGGKLIETRLVVQRD